MNVREITEDLKIVSGLKEGVGSNKLVVLKHSTVGVVRNLGGSFLALKLDYIFKTDVFTYEEDAIDWILA